MHTVGTKCSLEVSLRKSRRMFCLRMVIMNNEQWSGCRVGNRKSIPNMNQLKIPKYQVPEKKTKLNFASAYQFLNAISARTCMLDIRNLNLYIHEPNAKNKNTFQHNLLVDLVIWDLQPGTTLSRFPPGTDKQVAYCVWVLDKRPQRNVIRMQQCEWLVNG